MHSRKLLILSLYRSAVKPEPKRILDKQKQSCGLENLSRADEESIEFGHKGQVISCHEKETCQCGVAHGRVVHLDLSWEGDGDRGQTLKHLLSSKWHLRQAHSHSKWTSPRVNTILKNFLWISWWRNWTHCLTQFCCVCEHHASSSSAVLLKESINTMGKAQCQENRNKAPFFSSERSKNKETHDSLNTGFNKPDPMCWVGSKRTWKSMLIRRNICLSAGQYDLPVAHWSLQSAGSGSSSHARGFRIGQLIRSLTMLFRPCFLPEIHRKSVNVRWNFDLHLDSVAFNTCRWRQIRWKKCFCSHHLTSKRRRAQHFVLLEPVSPGVWTLSGLAPVAKPAPEVATGISDQTLPSICVCVGNVFAGASLHFQVARDKKHHETCLTFLAHEVAIFVLAMSSREYVTSDITKRVGTLTLFRDSFLPLSRTCAAFIILQSPKTSQETPPRRNNLCHLL